MMIPRQIAAEDYAHWAARRGNGKDAGDEILVDSLADGYKPIDRRREVLDGKRTRSHHI